MSESDEEVEVGDAASTILQESGDVESTFYFESDHVALKGNSDYHNLLKTIGLLESQRMRAIQDLDRLYEAQEDALKDPISFVNKLQQNVDLKLPKPQIIASLPQINWDVYTSNTDLAAGLCKHMTRHKKQALDTDTNVIPDCLQNSSTMDEKGFDIEVVRGRVKDDKKSSTFNKLWNIDEQRRLEDLLVQFPPEEIESKRWQKIATAFGNRTPIQVASRVQKYFIKLAKAGLPIPGRLPNMAYISRKASHRHQRFNRFYQHPSTFLQSHDPPVYMSDDDDSKSYGDCSIDQDGLPWDLNSPDVSDEETVAPELRDTEEYRELMKLKRLRKCKVQTEGYIHQGFKCDGCNCDPIVGVRWHCSDCPEESAVDFCDECADSNLETADHNSSHRIVPIRMDSSSCIDQDYTKFMPGDYNYLDSNYMPANR